MGIIMMTMIFTIILIAMLAITIIIVFVIVKRESVWGARAPPAFFFLFDPLLLLVTYSVLGSGRVQGPASKIN